MDTAVKQRLLGGIVLVAGAAVLLPLMLDGSGAKLLGRLEPMPAKPPVATVEQATPNLNQQQLEAEDDISQNQGQDEAAGPGQPARVWGCFGAPDGGGHGGVPPHDWPLVPAQAAHLVFAA